MSDETFRIVVAGGVIIAALSFLILGIVAIILAQLGYKFKAMIKPIVEQAKPIMGTVQQTAADLQPKIASISTQAVDLSKLVKTEAHHYGAVAKVLSESAVELSGVVVAEAHRYAEVSKEFAEKAVDISGLVQMEAHRYADISKDVAERTKVRIAEADDGINSAVAQVQIATGAVRSAVIRPFREIDGVLAGVGTAVATFARGRKAPVSRATQDEEMFI